ncbi:hypothetical protein JYT31_01390 [Beggiatoa alba]|nr:hypothetical protein [Beggiatoa alba]
MGRHNNNSVSRYALILCLGVTLLFGQTFKLHMHIQHDDITSSANAGYIIEVHAAFSQRDAVYDSLYKKDAQDHHHPAEIDIGSSGFVSKTKLLNPFVLLFSIISILLCVPQLYLFRRKPDFKTERPLSYYLLHPSLRAPPHLSPV